MGDLDIQRLPADRQNFLTLMYSDSSYFREYSQPFHNLQSSNIIIILTVFSISPQLWCQPWVQSVQRIQRDTWNNIVICDSPQIQPDNMRPLNQSPPELIDHILSRLSRSDLKAARLTCRALSGIATHWLYHSVYTRVTSFQKNVIRQEIEGLQELVSKFAPLVHSLDIDGGAYCCPFEVASFLDKLPALEKISIRGVRTSWYHDQLFHGDFERAMLRASLITPVENRILDDLKSCTVGPHSTCPRL